jgi:hypothetical protein
MLLQFVIWILFCWNFYILTNNFRSSIDSHIFISNFQSCEPDSGFSLILFFIKNVKIKIFQIIILPVVLYGCIKIDGVFENRVLGIIRPRRNQIIGHWRKLHNEELHNLYCSPNIINNDQVKEYKMGRASSTHGRGRNSYRVMCEN